MDVLAVRCCYIRINLHTSNYWQRNRWQSIQGLVFTFPCLCIVLQPFQLITCIEEALERQQYDLVLMDVQMPEMDGIEATRRIRSGFADEQQPRIVAMTAGAMPEDRQACLTAGMNGFLTKPIRLDQLLAVLEGSERIRETN